MEIELPDGTILEAPDDADPSAVAKAYLAKQNQAAQPPRQRTWGEQIKRDAGLTARAGLNAVAALPMMAADFGVAARNLFPGQNYELPSSMWRRGLTDIGLPEPEGLREKASMTVGEIAMGGALPAPSSLSSTTQLAPSNFSRPLTSRELTLQAANKEGLAVPPSTTNPTVTNKLLESLGGKVATAQDASMRNEAGINALANRAIGRVGNEIADDALSSVRTAAAEAYKPLRGIGTMRADSQYTKALEKIAAPYAKASKDFPGISKSADEILSAVNSVKKQSFDSDSAVDAIAIFRENADKAYATGDKALGKAYKAIASAMEDAIERSLSRRGEEAGTILKDFRSARELIAKTYSIEGAKVGGSASATKLATQLAKQKPLSGELKLAAQFGRDFPKASQLVRDSGSVRNTDVAAGAITAALSKEPSWLMYPFARQAARSFLLSPTGQRMAIRQLPNESPRAAMGILYGADNLDGLLSQ